MSGWFPKLAAQSSLGALGLLLFGYLLADSVVGRRPLDALGRWALAFPALVAYAFALMVVHMATGGRVFSNPWVVRSISIGIAVLLAVRRIRVRAGRPQTSRTAALAVGAIVLLGVVVWGVPVARMVPLAPPGSDTGWHMGWTSQLLNGETTPSALITGNVPNYYPWMFHGLAALVANLTPGGRAYDTLDPLQLIQATGALIALFALGVQLGKTWQSGAAVAVLGGIAAGLPFALVRAFDRVLSTPRLGGPRGTYNAVFNNLAPPLPRDVAYSLFLPFLLLLVLGMTRTDRFLLVAASVTVGLIGLSAAEYFFIALGVSALSIAFLPRSSRRRASIAALFVPALMVYAAWFVPLAVSYRRLGGFVNTTSVRAIVLSPVAILMSWGLCTPFALYGAIRWIPRARRESGARVLLATLVVSGAIVAGASLVPLVLGEGFRIVGRASRYWPVLHLAVAMYGGLAMAALLERTGQASRALAVALSLVILALVVPLPLDVSRDYPDRVARSPALAEALLGSGRNVLTDLAEAGRGTCVLATPTLAFTAFSYTGYRLTAYEGSPGHQGNFARIRWRDIYDHIPSDNMRLADLQVLIGGGTDRARFMEVLQRYRVNLLVVPRDRASAAVYQGLRDLSEGGSDPYAVFLVATCDH